MRKSSRGDNFSCTLKFGSHRIQRSDVFYTRTKDRAKKSELKRVTLRCTRRKQLQRGSNTWYQVLINEIPT